MMRRAVLVGVVVVLVVVVTSLFAVWQVRSPEVQQITVVDVYPGLSARIVDVMLENETYRAGDTVRASMLIENTGNVTITQELVRVDVYVLSLKSIAGNIFLKTLSDQERTRSTMLEYQVVIKPGERKTLRASFDTVEEMGGVKLAGKYRVTITLYVSPDDVPKRVHSKVMEIELE